MTYTPTFVNQKLGGPQQSKAFFNYTFDKGRLKSLVSWTLENYGHYKTVELLDQLKKIGFEYATKAGISLGIDDLKIPPKKQKLLVTAEKLTKLTQYQYERADITAVERFQRLIETWHRTSEQLKQEVINHFEETDVLNPVYMMAFSGARGNISQVRQLVGMRGLMSNPQGQIIDFPIRSNFREGLTLTEYIISSYGARKGIVDTALRTANAGYLTRRLVDVAQHVIISHFDCGTQKGIFLTDIKDNNKLAVSVEKRIVGRVLARDIYKPNTTTKEYATQVLRNGTTDKEYIKVFSRNQEISSDIAFEITKLTNKIFVRSPLTCNTTKLLCQLCYGWSLAQGNLVSVGEAVGVIAAQSIGEPGTQLTMRTFHTGGVFAGDVSDEIRAPYNGFVYYEKSIPGILMRAIDGKILFLTKSEGTLFFSKNSLLKTPNSSLSGGHALHTGDVCSQDIKKYKIPAYTILFMRNGEEVFPKQVVAQITSINKKTKTHNTQQLVLQSDFEGMFYGKNLRIQKSIIGPKPKYAGKDKDILLINPKAMEIIIKARGWNFGWVLSGKRYELPLLLKSFPIVGDYITPQTIITRHSLKLPCNTKNHYKTFNTLKLNKVNQKTKLNSKTDNRFTGGIGNVQQNNFVDRITSKHSGYLDYDLQSFMKSGLSFTPKIKTTKNLNLFNKKYLNTFLKDLKTIKKTGLSNVLTNLITKKPNRKQNYHDKTASDGAKFATQTLHNHKRLVVLKQKQIKSKNKLWNFVKQYFITKKEFSSSLDKTLQNIFVNTNQELSSKPFNTEKSLPNHLPITLNNFSNKTTSLRTTSTGFISKENVNYTPILKTWSKNLKIKQDLVFLNLQKIKYHKHSYFHFFNSNDLIANKPTYNISFFISPDKNTNVNKNLVSTSRVCGANAVGKALENYPAMLRTPRDTRCAPQLLPEFATQTLPQLLGQKLWDAQHLSKSCGRYAPRNNMKPKKPIFNYKISYNEIMVAPLGVSNTFNNSLASGLLKKHNIKNNTLLKRFKTYNNLLEWLSKPTKSFTSPGAYAPMMQSIIAKNIKQKRKLSLISNTVPTSKALFIKTLKELISLKKKGTALRRSSGALAQSAKHKVNPSILVDSDAALVILKQNKLSHKILDCFKIFSRPNNKIPTFIKPTTTKKLFTYKKSYKKIDSKNTSTKQAPISKRKIYYKHQTNLQNNLFGLFIRDNKKSNNINSGILKQTQHAFLKSRALLKQSLPNNLATHGFTMIKPNYINNLTKQIRHFKNNNNSTPFIAKKQAKAVWDKNNFHFAVKQKSMYASSFACWGRMTPGSKSLKPGSLFASCKTMPSAFADRANLGKDFLSSYNYLFKKSIYFQPQFKICKYATVTAKHTEHNGKNQILKHFKKISKIARVLPTGQNKQSLGILQSRIPNGSFNENCKNNSVHINKNIQKTFKNSSSASSSPYKVESTSPTFHNQLKDKKPKDFFFNKPLSLINNHFKLTNNNLDYLLCFGFWVVGCGLCPGSIPPTKCGAQHPTTFVPKVVGGIVLPEVKQTKVAKQPSVYKRFACFVHAAQKVTRTQQKLAKFCNILDTLVSSARSITKPCDLLILTKKISVLYKVKLLKASYNYFIDTTNMVLKKTKHGLVTLRVLSRKQNNQNKTDKTANPKPVFYQNTSPGGIHPQYAQRNTSQLNQVVYILVNKVFNKNTTPDTVFMHRILGKTKITETLKPDFLKNNLSWIKNKKPRFLPNTFNAPPTGGVDPQDSGFAPQQNKPSIVSPEFAPQTQKVSNFVTLIQAENNYNKLAITREGWPQESTLGFCKAESNWNNLKHKSYNNLSLKDRPGGIRPQHAKHELIKKNRQALKLFNLLLLKQTLTTAWKAWSDSTFGHALHKDFWDASHPTTFVPKVVGGKTNKSLIDNVKQLRFLKWQQQLGSNVLISSLNKTWAQTQNHRILGFNTGNKFLKISMPNLPTTFVPKVVGHKKYLFYIKINKITQLNQNCAGTLISKLPKQKKDLCLLPKIPNFALVINNYKNKENLKNGQTDNKRVEPRGIGNFWNYVSHPTTFVLPSVKQKLWEEAPLGFGSLSFISEKTKTESIAKQTTLRVLGATRCVATFLPKVITYIKPPFFDLHTKEPSYFFAHTAKSLSKYIPKQPCINIGFSTKIASQQNPTSLHFPGGIGNFWNYVSHTGDHASRTGDVCPQEATLGFYSHNFWDKSCGNSHCPTTFVPKVVGTGGKTNKSLNEKSGPQTVKHKMNFNRSGFGWVVGCAQNQLCSTYWGHMSPGQNPKHKSTIMEVLNQTNLLTQRNFYSPFEGELIHMKPYKNYLVLNPYAYEKVSNLGTYVPNTRSVKLLARNKKNQKKLNTNRRTQEEIRMALFDYYLSTVNRVRYNFLSPLDKTFITDDFYGKHFETKLENQAVKTWSRFNLVLTKTDLITLNTTPFTTSYAFSKAGFLLNSALHPQEGVLFMYNKALQNTKISYCINKICESYIKNTLKLKTIIELNKETHFNKAYNFNLKNKWFEMQRNYLENSLPVAVEKKTLSFQALKNLTQSITTQNQNKHNFVLLSSKTSNCFPIKIKIQLKSKILLKTLKQKTKHVIYMPSVSLVNKNWHSFNQKKLLTKNKIGFFFLKGNPFLHGLSTKIALSNSNHLFGPLAQHKHGLSSITTHSASSKMYTNIFGVFNSLVQDLRYRNSQYCAEIQRLHLNQKFLKVNPWLDKHCFNKRSMLGFCPKGKTNKVWGFCGAESQTLVSSEDARIFDHCFTRGKTNKSLNAEHGHNHAKDHTGGVRPQTATFLKIYCFDSAQLDSYKNLLIKGNSKAIFAQNLKIKQMVFGIKIASARQNMGASAFSMPSIIRLPIITFSAYALQSYTVSNNFKTDDRLSSCDLLNCQNITNSSAELPSNFIKIKYQKLFDILKPIDFANLGALATFVAAIPNTTQHLKCEHRSMKTSVSVLNKLCSTYIYLQQEFFIPKLLDSGYGLDTSTIKNKKLFLTKQIADSASFKTTLKINKTLTTKLYSSEQNYSFNKNVLAWLGLSKNISLYYLTQSLDLDLVQVFNSLKKLQNNLVLSVFDGQAKQTQIFYAPGCATSAKPHHTEGLGPHELVWQKAKIFVEDSRKLDAGASTNLLVIKRSGQLMHMNKQKITIRIGQPLVISPNSIIHASHGDFIFSKTPVINLTYQQLQTGDIVQGIPKIEQLFEARTTKRGRLFKDNITNLLTGLFLKYFIKTTYLFRKNMLNVFTDKPQISSVSYASHIGGQHPQGASTEIKYNKTALETIILSLALEWSVKQSFYKIQEIIVDGILRVYRSQGVSIADKHVEIIVKQMTSKVRIINSNKIKLKDYSFTLNTINAYFGKKTKTNKIFENTLLEQLLSNNFKNPTGLFPGEIVDLDFVENINTRFCYQSSAYVTQADAMHIAENHDNIEPLKYEPIVLGITRASLEVESFLSAASFQQTTRVLSQAALYKKKDFLKGLKENIIIGNLIPAGTGYISNLSF